MIKSYTREYRDNGKWNGNYYSIMGYILGHIGIMEKTMETTIEYEDFGFKNRSMEWNNDRIVLLPASL